jgi:hypothetical protein
MFLRALIIIAALAAPAGMANAGSGDRYGADQAPRLRQTPDAAAKPLLSWPGREARLRELPPRQSRAAAPLPLIGLEAPAPPPTPQPQAQLPTSIYDTPPPPQRQAAASAPEYIQRPDGRAPQIGSMAPRRYSVVREFGGQPDAIPIPKPSVLAYAPEMANAVLAQQERDRISADPGPASPADLDMLERRQQDADREAARERAQARNRDKK